jgi:hypothetical protein
MAGKTPGLDFAIQMAVRDLLKLAFGFVGGTSWDEFSKVFNEGATEKYNVSVLEEMSRTKTVKGVERGGARAGIVVRKAEPCKLRCVTIQMVGPSKYQGNGLARALAVRLCIALMGCFASGFELPQPTQSSNPVIGAYKCPAFGVVAYGPPSGLPAPPDVAIPKPIATANSLA